MQPLAYQVGKTTCWPTFMINGIMYLRDGKQITSPKYKTMHAALNSLLWNTGVWYHEDADFTAFEHVGKYQNPWGQP